MEKEQIKKQIQAIEDVTKEAGKSKESARNFLVGVGIVDSGVVSKYPINGYAYGNYHCKCVGCGQMFFGDKRAVQCQPCATKGIEFNGTEWVATPTSEELRDNQTDLWKEVAKLFTGIVGNSQWLEAIEKAKGIYTINKK